MIYAAAEICVHPHIRSLFSHSSQSQCLLTPFELWWNGENGCEKYFSCVRVREYLRKLENSVHPQVFVFFYLFYFYGVG